MRSLSILECQRKSSSNFSLVATQLASPSVGLLSACYKSTRTGCWVGLQLPRWHRRDRGVRERERCPSLPHRGRPEVSAGEHPGLAAGSWKKVIPTLYCSSGEHAHTPSVTTVLYVHSLSTSTRFAPPEATSASAPN